MELVLVRNSAALLTLEFRLPAIHADVIRIVCHDKVGKSFSSMVFGLWPLARGIKI